jgi:tRNA modification GTPase
MVKGIAVALIDVAGVREIDDIDAVEAIGIERAHQELARADAVLWLVDATNAHRDDEHFDVLFSDLQTPLLKVYTKSDLLKGSIDVEPNATLISAQTQSGLGDLAQRVFDLLVSDVPAPQDVLLTRTRQKDEVVLAHASMQSAHEALRQGQPDEVVASELRAAGQALDRLLGKSLNEEVLDLIFSRFCIGK